MKSSNSDLFPGMGERIFTIAEISKQYKFHPDTIRKLFAGEAGVIALTRTRAGKRTYTSYRIPENVLNRVFAAITTGIAA